MNFDVCADSAQKLAESAKSGTLKLDGSLFTFEFCQKTWSYKVHKDKVFYINFNTKSIKQANRWLRDYESN